MGIVSALTKLLGYKKMLIRNAVIAGVVFGALILCVPRYYSCDVKLAPEVSSGGGLMGSFGSLASSLGINLGSGMNSDAISPALYPDIFASKEFQTELFDIKVTTSDGSLTTDLYTYMEKHQSAPWWTTAFNSTKRFVKNMFASDTEGAAASKGVNPFRLTEKQYQVAEAIGNKISCSVSQTDGIITITVNDQDPLVCATLADSVKVRLQNYITRYRTSKARNDMDYYAKLLEQSKKDYDKAVKAYTIYADTHRDVIMQSYISERDQLENEMQAKFSIYTALTQQYEQSKAKLQETTPAFTTLQCASVPIKPAGPKRVIYTLIVVMLTLFATAYYILSGKELLRKIRNRKSAAADESAAEEMAASGAEDEPAAEIIEATSADDESHNDPKE